MIQLTGEVFLGDLTFTIRAREVGVAPVDCIVTVTADLQKPYEGFAQGRVYLHETDAGNRVVIEPGPDHRTIYVSPTGYTEEQIRVAESRSSPISAFYYQYNLATGDTNTGTLWGSTPALAVDNAVGMGIWGGRLANGDSSTWILFERGGTGYYFKRPASATSLPTYGRGYSPLHPLFIGAWGTGAKPAFDIFGTQQAYEAQHLVIQDLVINDDNGHKVSFLAQRNIVFDSVETTDNEFTFTTMTSGVSLLNIKSVGVTYPNFTDANPAYTYWDANGTRISGIYASGVRGLLISGCYFDHSGWKDGFSTTLSNPNFQPPSKYSHGAYLAANNRDTNVIGSVFLKCSSSGIQHRSSGYTEGNVLIANGINFGAVAVGVISDGNPATDPCKANFFYCQDNLITQGGRKNVDGGTYEGAQNRGMDNNSPGSVILSTVMAHYTNPAAPETLVDGQGLSSHYATAPVVNEMKVYRYGPTDANIGGLDTDDLDLCTIERYADEVRSVSYGTSTVDDLEDWLDTQTASPALARDILDYFFPVFGITDLPSRVTPATITFTPYLSGDAVRWDNRQNWDTADTPIDGDSVDLDGWFVRSGRHTVAPASLDLGNGGRLLVTGGKIEVTTALTCGADGGRLDVDYAGQLSIPGYAGAGAIAVDVTGGRFTNSGSVTGPVSVTARGESEVLLALEGESATLAGLTVYGEARVGFDGDSAGSASVTLTALTIKPTMRIPYDGQNLTNYAPKQGETVTTVAGFSGTISRIEYGDSKSGNLFVDDYTGPKPADNAALSAIAYEQTPDLPTASPVQLGLVNGTPVLVLPTIGKFQSCLFGAVAPDVVTAIACGDSITVDVTSVAAGIYDLIVADSVTGTFDTETIVGGSGTISYTATKVQLTI